jgi:acyl-coenzyme A synthetase/AMP-(fatty) acid ligase
MKDKREICDLEEVWEPHPGDYCWFWDDKFSNRQLLRFRSKWRDNYYTTTDGVTLTEDGELVYTDYFTHCKPFNGELPEHLKEK